ncbi:MAG: rhomboid family intramembrane serine protease [Acidobacteriota bacterium]
MAAEPPEIAGHTERRFRVCPQCRLLTPAQLPTCVECGYRSYEIVAIEKETRFIKEFITRATPFTYIIFAINLLVFVLMIFYGGTTNIETLRSFGAEENTLILQGEYWRLITPIFIHSGIIHMGFNSYALISLGPAVEKLYGSARFVVIYLIAGVTAVLGSFIWSILIARTGLAVGASGAIFGLLGALSVFGYKYRSELPESFRRAFGTRMIVTIVLNLYIGFVLPGIDNAAHISGLIAGAISAIFIPYLPPGGQRKAIWTVLQLICLLIIAGSFLKVWFGYQEPKFSLDISLANALLHPDVNGYIDTWNTGERAFKDSYIMLNRACQQGEKLEEEKIKTILDGGLKAFTRLPRLDRKANTFLPRLKQLIAGNLVLVDKYQEGKLSLADLEVQAHNYAQLTQDFSAWTQTEGRNYHIIYTPEQLE